MMSVVAFGPPPWRLGRSLLKILLDIAARFIEAVLMLSDLFLLSAINADSTHCSGVTSAHSLSRAMDNVLTDKRAEWLSENLPRSLCKYPQTSADFGQRAGTRNSGFAP